MELKHTETPKELGLQGLTFGFVPASIECLF